VKSKGPAKRKVIVFGFREKDKKKERFWGENQKGGLFSKGREAAKNGG